jgi:nucleoside-diphosphate-sugar epimerase
MTLREFVELIASELSERGFAPVLAFGARPYRSDEVMFFTPAVSRLRDVLGWLPDSEIEGNIGHTIDWFLSHDQS